MLFKEGDFWMNRNELDQIATDVFQHYLNNNIDDAEREKVLTIEEIVKRLIWT